MNKMSTTISFAPIASRPKNGLALIYDLEGFSGFFNQPDVQDYVPKFFNEVSHALSVCIFGGKPYWHPRSSTLTYKALVGMTPIHEKFMGDGAMYLWTVNKDEALVSGFIHALCNQLWDLKNNFDEVIRKASDQVPVMDVPQRIRFGLARGTIYKLTRRNSNQREYIGFCINLASRLQKYCPELGFIASARINLSEKELKESGYIKVIAKQIKGFPKEIVIVDGNEFEGLNPDTKTLYFDPV